MSHLITLQRATDTDLQICASQIGFKGDERLVKDPFPLSRDDRNTLIRVIQQSGYRSIDITNTDDIKPSKVNKYYEQNKRQ